MKKLETEIKSLREELDAERKKDSGPSVAVAYLFELFSHPFH